MEGTTGDGGEVLAGELASFSTISDPQTVGEFAQQAVATRERDPDKPYVQLLPAGSRAEYLPPMDELRDNPRRANGTVKVATVESLIAYLKEHGDIGGATTVWVHPTEGKVRAVINDHAGDGEGTPGWGDYRAELDLIPTPEWTFWTKADGNMVGQVEFAQHIEQGLPEIVTPDGAELLEIAQTFHATTEAKFRSAHRLTNGEVKVQYDEDIQATAGSSADMTIPTEFVLAIAPFIGEDPEPLTARLRYRVSGGNLSLGYQLIRPHEVVDGRLTAMAEQLESEFERVYRGSPRAAVQR